MNAPEPAPESPPPDAPDGAPEEAPPAEFARQRWWKIYLRMMLAPMAFLAPCVSCGAAITFKHSFGPVGAVLGAMIGFVIGSGLVVFWYVFVDDVFGEVREARFADRMTREARAGSFRRRLGRPGEGPADVAPIPLDGGAGAVDIDTGVGTAIARIEAHGDAQEALAAAEKLRTRHPRDPRVTSVLARTLLRAGRPNEGARIASDGLHAAVLTNQLNSVPALVRAFWGHREALSLDQAVAHAVAAHLEHEGFTDEAAYFRDGRSSLA